MDYGHDTLVNRNIVTISPNYIMISYFSVSNPQQGLSRIEVLLCMYATMHAYVMYIKSDPRTQHVYFISGK